MSNEALLAKAQRAKPEWMRRGQRGPLSVLERARNLTEVVEDLDFLESSGYGNPRTSEEAIIWLNNYDNMVIQAVETDDEARLKYWRLWKRELEPYEKDYWVSLFKRMWKAQMNGVVENRLGL